MPRIYVRLQPMLGAVVMASIGIAVACAGWLWQTTLNEFVDRSRQVDAEIVAIKTSKNSQFPVFSYTDETGMRRVVKSSYPLSGYAVGDKVQVAYDPFNPADAMIPEAVSYALGPLVVMGFGMVFTLIAIYAGATGAARGTRQR